MGPKLTPDTSLPFDGEEIIVPYGTAGEFEQRLLEGFTSNEAHYHSSFDETYFVAHGTISVALKTPNSDVLDIREYRKFEAVIIPRGTSHRVLQGASDNVILVTYSPRYIESDRTVDVRLEEAAQQLQSGLCAPALADNELSPQLATFRRLMLLEEHARQQRERDREVADRSVREMGGW
jgi:oxalate decarboxylase/phosphoglucose isomerase-like protein (cupin superfamily)